MHDSGCELRTGIDRRNDGVLATRDFARGDTVLPAVPSRPVPANHSHANQVSLTSWSFEDGLPPKVNHSCDPNCGVRANPAVKDGFDFVALRAIAAGDEVTFDYAMRNYAIEHFPVRCLCGAANCRGTITGWKDLPEERKAAYGALVAPYLLDADAATPKRLSPRREPTRAAAHRRSTRPPASSGRGP